MKLFLKGDVKKKCYVMINETKTDTVAKGTLVDMG